MWLIRQPGDDRLAVLRVPMLITRWLSRLSSIAKHRVRSKSTEFCEVLGLDPMKRRMGRVPLPVARQARIEHPTVVRDALVVECPASLLAVVRERDVP
jgi:hypothetical protein